MSNLEEYFNTNRALWNLKTPIHADSKMYDVEGFKNGKHSLRFIELEEVGDVQDKTLLHLQCHFGMDTLSWAKLGAKVTGVDFSDKAIALANSLSVELNIPADFICCNIFDLKENLEGQFDIVFTSYGTIGWLPDIDRWASIVAHFLKPGGSFHIIEFHPYLWMLDDEFKELKYSYFHTDEPITETTQSTYADPEIALVHKEYGWNHSISDVITALLNQGLVIRSMKEYPFSVYNCFPNMKEIGEHKWVFEYQGDKIPYIYSLKAVKP